MEFNKDQSIRQSSLFSIKVTFEKQPNDSCDRVPYGEIHRKKCDQAYEWLTVVSEKGEKLVESQKIPANESYIITSKGQIKVQ